MERDFETWVMVVLCSFNLGASCTDFRNFYMNECVGLVGTWEEGRVG